MTYITAAATPAAPTLVERYYGAYITNFLTFQACRVAVELEIAEQLSNGPLSLDDLATRTHAHAPSLFRLLRWLESVGVFKQVLPRVFANTPDSEFLRKGTPGSIWASCRAFYACGFSQAFDGLSDGVRTGRVAFELIHGCTLWEYLDRDPERAALFHQMITTHPASAVTAAWDWSQFPLIADIGGGVGSQLIDILKAHPGCRGILFDRPEVLARATPHDRMECISGNFFENVPTGADAHILRYVIHDWPDPEAAAILRTIRASAKPNSRVILIERVIPETSAFDYGKLSDLYMLTYMGGQERTAAEYRQLLENAGFEFEQIVSTPSGLSLIISRPRD